jgi:ubiquinone/menaquinone biosynthesis C-methylase UbiE
MSDPQGLTFDTVALDYDRGRPGWPGSMLEGIEAVDVLDLAAGTGKLTRLLLDRYHHVIAVEPLAGMRALLPPHAEMLHGSAEAVPLSDCSVDAAFVAEAFHWFDSTAAVRELARVVRPAGTVLVCINTWRGAYEPPIGARAEHVLKERWARLPPPGGPKVENGKWKRGFVGQPFSALEARSYDHEMETDRDGVAAYYSSTSSTAQLAAAERAELRAELVDALADVPYRLPLTAQVYTARRLSRG